MGAMSAVGLVVHEQRPEAADLASETATWLGDLGHAVRLPRPDAERVGLSELAVDGDAFADGLDAVVSLGGDGTILRTVGLLAGAAVPIIGVNLGQLGYLTEIEAPNLRACLEAVLAGSFETDDRMLLDVMVIRNAEAATTHTVALNEAVLEREGTGHTIRIDVELDGTPFTPYEADALIVCTPTGSTAYAFSARGPIIEPSHRALLLTPVSPHMLFDRSLVLDTHTVVRLTVTRHRHAILTVDGRDLGPLAPGDSVECSASDRVARLVTTRPNRFHAVLKAKFGLSDR
jgi:NAD+ kinase